MEAHPAHKKGWNMAGQISVLHQVTLMASQNGLGWPTKMVKPGLGLISLAMPSH